MESAERKRIVATLRTLKQNHASTTPGSASHRWQVERIAKLESKLGEYK